MATITTREGIRSRRDAARSDDYPRQREDDDRCLYHC
jgi:hypothetical protein